MSRDSFTYNIRDYRCDYADPCFDNHYPANRLLYKPSCESIKHIMLEVMQRLERIEVIEGINTAYIILYVNKVPEVIVNTDTYIEIASHAKSRRHAIYLYPEP